MERMRRRRREKDFNALPQCVGDSPAVIWRGGLLFVHGSLLKTSFRNILYPSEVEHAAYSDRL